MDSFYRTSNNKCYPCSTGCASCYSLNKCMACESGLILINR